MSALTVRPAAAGDDAFLRAVYAAARAEEVAGFGWAEEQAQAFLAMQYEAQRRHYRSAWPRAVDGIVEAAGEPVGRLYVDRGAAAVTVLDIALLPGTRGSGIGTVLLRGLQAEAAALDVPVELQVVPGNRAVRWYGRLGFRSTESGSSASGERIAMRWRPPGHAEWAAAVGVPGTLAGVRALPAECSPALRLGPFEQFSVALRVPADAAFAQGTHRFEHPALGALDLFVVPSARTGDDLTLTVAFARTVAS
ncbi:N-acetyltransferase family protein [Dactylosporangium sp. CS-033363]|uniref:GNAT family N-acetyltransferase n=1 Tax=Dactylosporangium sp. CS-033363 TaxID=3239935 RepID=UPI003D8DFEA2